MIGRQVDLTSLSVNIDNLIDRMVAVQQENGVPVHMSECGFDPVTKKRVNRFHKKILKDQGVDLKSYMTLSSQSNEEIPVQESQIKRGVFVYDSSDLIEEDDSPYVCEDCVELGYNGEYIAETCDLCEICSNCQHMTNGDCDGCVYSPIYRGGITYGEFMSNGDTTFDTLNDKDKMLIEEVDSDKCLSRRRGLSGFSITEI